MKNTQNLDNFDLIAFLLRRRTISCCDIMSNTEERLRSSISVIKNNARKKNNTNIQLHINKKEKLVLLNARNLTLQKNANGRQQVLSRV